MARRVEALGGIFRSWLARIWVFGGAAGGYLSIRMRPVWLAETAGALGHDRCLCAVVGLASNRSARLHYGLFEYVRRGVQLAPAGPSSPAADEAEMRQRWWDSIKNSMGSVAQSIGIALGSGGTFRYRAAASDAETLLLQLSERHGLEVPDLRKDGEKVGCMRALLYITDLSPILVLNDQEKARAKAAELARWLNGLDEAALTNLVKLDADVGYFL